MMKISNQPIINKKCSEPKANKLSTPVEQSRVDCESMVGAKALGNQNIAFMSLKVSKPIPKYDKNVVSDNPNNPYLQALNKSPRYFYIKNGLQINNFLRKGELQYVADVSHEPEQKRVILEEYFGDKKDYNRAIVESPKIIDEIFTDCIKEPMTVYRYAPKTWVDNQKDGILEDKAFFSTTTVLGGTLEAYVNQDTKTCYKIKVPEGMPCVDMTDEGESEILFPRGLKFRVIDNETLEMIKE